MYTTVAAHKVHEDLQNAGRENFSYESCVLIVADRERDEEELGKKTEYDMVELCCTYEEMRLSTYLKEKAAEIYQELELFDWCTLLDELGGSISSEKYTELLDAEEEDDFAEKFASYLEEIRKMDAEALVAWLRDTIRVESLIWYTTYVDASGNKHDGVLFRS